MSIKFHFVEHANLTKKKLLNRMHMCICIERYIKINFMCSLNSPLEFFFGLRATKSECLKVLI